MSWRSSLEVWGVATGQSRVILRTPMLIEAPNWHPDGWWTKIVIGLLLLVFILLQKGLLTLSARR